MSTDKFLTFKISADDANARLAITGRFDLDYGFSMVRTGDKALSFFSAEGISLKKGENDKVEFIVSTCGPLPKHRFNLKFADANYTKYGVDSDGQIEIESIQLADSPSSLP